MFEGSYVSLRDKIAGGLQNSYISSYLQPDEIANDKNIFPSSLTHTFKQCEELDISQLTSGRPDIYTKVKMGPIGGRATILQNNDIYYSFNIPANTWGLQVGRNRVINDPAVRDITLVNNVEFTPLTRTQMRVVTVADNSSNNQISGRTVRLFFAYDNASQIANQLTTLYMNSVPSAIESGVYQPTYAMLGSLSITDGIRANNHSLNTLKSMVEDGFCGAGCMVDVVLDEAQEGGGGVHWVRLNRSIEITGIIDFSFLNPIYNHFPIMTSHFKNLYLKLTMQNFLRGLKWGSIPVCDGYGRFPIEKRPLNCVIPAVVQVGGDHPLFTTGVPASKYRSDQSAVILLRLIRMDDSGGAGIDVEHGDIVTFHPTVEIYNTPNISFNTFEIRQTEFVLENEADVDQMFKASGQYTIFTQNFETIECREGTSQPNISAISSNYNQKALFITFPWYGLQAQTYCPNPLLKNFRVMYNQQYLVQKNENIIDDIVEKRIVSTFVDTDMVSPSHELLSSIRYQSYNGKSHTNYDGPPGNDVGQSNHSLNKIYNGLHGHCCGEFYLNQTGAVQDTFLGMPAGSHVREKGKNMLFYHPNTFCYAIPLAPNSTFRRGYNSTLLGPTNSITIQLTGDASTYQEEKLRSGSTGVNAQPRISGNINDSCNFISPNDLLTQDIHPLVNILCDCQITFQFDPVSGDVVGISKAY
jgi:hypothetical protein